MFNILSALIGVVALLVALVGIIPLLGWLNWLALFIAVIGLAIGALSGQKAGRNLNIVVLVIGGFRLFLGGGII